MSAIEIWKPVVGYEGRYEVSNLGRIFSIDSGHPATGRILNAAPNKRGYPRVCLTDANGARRARFVHSLVCEAFHGPCPSGMETLHRNGVHADNQKENLRWGTHQENANDAKAHGAISIGEFCHNSKITDNQVVEIIQLSNTLTHAEIGGRYGITERYVYEIAKGYAPRARRIINSGMLIASRNTEDIPACRGLVAGR